MKTPSSRIGARASRYGVRLATSFFLALSGGIGGSVSVESLDEDLDSIHSALDWYLTSIHSYRISYRTVTTYDQKGWKRQQAEFKRLGELQGSIPDVPKPYETQHELVRSGDKLFLKTVHYHDEPGAIAFDTIVFDGRNTYHTKYDREGKAHQAAFSEGADGVVAFMDSPVVYVGLQAYRVNSEPLLRLNDLVSREKCALIRATKLEGNVVYQVDSHPGDVGPNQEVTRRYYLDPSHDLLPVRMEFCDVSSGKPRMTHSVREWRRISDARDERQRWFPTKGAFEDYWEPGLLFSVTETTVEDVSLNPVVSAQQFKVEIPDGIPVINNLTHEARMSGSDRARDEIARRLIEASRQSLADALEAAANREKISATPRGELPAVSIALVVAGVLCIFGAYWFRRCS